VIASKTRAAKRDLEEIASSGGQLHQMQKRFVVLLNNAFGTK
jgi:hypothetical protein